MRALATLLAALLLSSCHTHRQSAEHAEDMEADTLRMERIEATAAATDYFASLLAVCDSLRMRMAADSIVTPHGIIYHPVIEADAAAPKVEAAAGASVQTAGGEATTIEARHESATTSDRESATEATAIAEPPATGGAWLWIGAAAIVAAAILIRRRPP